jgi:outer membrane protein OmpA-like peptidoglycan-associated protein
MTKQTRRRGRPGPALTIGLPVALAAFAGSWGYQYYKDVARAPAPEVVAAGLQEPITFRVAADPWSGYSTFRNEPRLTAALAKHDITVQYLDQERFYDQNERLRALAAGEIDIALTTLDAFLQHGAVNLDGGLFPGTIIFGVDESAGGDAIFLEKGRSSFDDVKPTDVVCFAEGTPSEHLWDFASLAFANLGDSLQKNNGVVAKDCWDKLEAGSAQVAVLWQPYTAIAEKAGYPKVFATGGQADDVIVDIAVVNRKVSSEREQALQQLVTSYFEVIDGYQKDRPGHGAFVTLDCGVECASDAELGDAVLDGIDFLTFEENLCLWFGECSTPGKLEPRVGKTGRLLIAKGKLDAAAVPSPESIIDRRFVLGVKNQRVEAAKLAQVVAGPDTDIALPTFAARDTSFDYMVPGAEGSAAVGTLRLPNVFFREGSYGLTDDAKATVGEIAETLRSFPALCVRISGHTNSNGAAAANRKLSRFRAMAIAAHLTHIDPRSFPEGRFEVHGYGSDRPVVGDGVEDAKASRRTEFTLFTCSG